MSGTNGHGRVVGPKDSAKLRFQWTLPNCGTNGHCRVAVTMDNAQSRDQGTTPNRGTNGHCQVAGPTHNAKLRDQQTTSCGTNGHRQIVGPTIACTPIMFFLGSVSEHFQPSIFVSVPNTEHSLLGSSFPICWDKDSTGKEEPVSDNLQYIVRYYMRVN